MKTNRIIASLLFAAGLSGALPTLAQEQTVKLTTAKPVGSELTLMVNRSADVLVDWGDGQLTGQASDPDETLNILKGKTTGQTITLHAKKGLEVLICAGNELTALDVTEATNLRSLYCQNNKLTALNLAGLTKLTDLNCANNELTTASVTSLTEKTLPAIENINLANNKFTKSFRIESDNLQQVNISNNGFTTLTVTIAPNIDVLNCAGNSLKALYLTSSAGLSVLNCHNNPELKTLSVNKSTGLPLMQQAVTDGCVLTELDLSKSEDLTYLTCANNQLHNLLLPDTKLTVLNCGNNQLTFRSFPSANNKPEKHFTYQPQADLDVTKGMKLYEGNPYIDLCPSWSERENADYVLNLEDYRIDGGGKRPTVTFTWYSIDYTATPNPVETELVAATSTNKEQDYYSKNGKFSFLKGYPYVYAKLTSSSYPDMTIKTTKFAVGKENVDLTAIEDVTTEADELNISAQGGKLTMSSNRPVGVGVWTVDGKQVWRGSVGSAAVALDLPKGVYIVNGKKVLL